MFTGIIQDVGTVVGSKRLGDLIRLSIRPSVPMEDLSLGESIAVDGVCLTVAELSGGSFVVEVSTETLQRTTIGDLVAGRRVNLERALRPTDRLGGHIVTGHVDGVGVIQRKRAITETVELRIGVAGSLERHIVEKGSVAVDGISLTVNRCGSGWFDLMLIPHTIARTTLAQKGEGERVNVECDIVGKYVAKLLGPWIGKAPKADGEGLTMEKLREHGFI
jgi:riboflavin synthase